MQLSLIKTLYIPALEKKTTYPVAESHKDKIAPVTTLTNNDLVNDKDDFFYKCLILNKSGHGNVFTKTLDYNSNIFSWICFLVITLTLTAPLYFAISNSFYCLVASIVFDCIFIPSYGVCIYSYEEEKHNYNMQKYVPVKYHEYIRKSLQGTVENRKKVINEFKLDR